MQTTQTQAKNLTLRALDRWLCSHPTAATIAAEAVRSWERSQIRDCCDDLGEETFMVVDAAAPDGYYLCGRGWCVCDPCREGETICAHSLAVCLLLGYRSHFARLSAAAPLRKVAVVVKSAAAKPLTIRASSQQLGERLATCRDQLIAGKGGVR